MDAVIVITTVLVVLIVAAWGAKIHQYVKSGEWQIDERLKSL